MFNNIKIYEDFLSNQMKDLKTRGLVSESSSSKMIPRIDRKRVMELARQAADGMLSYDAEGEFRLNQQEVFKFAELLLRSHGSSGLVKGLRNGN